MHEAERLGVQGLTWKRGHLAARCLGQSLAPAAAARVAVKRIANQRMAALAQMDADLVRPPSRQAAFDRGGDAVELAQHPVMGERGSSAARQYGHFLAIDRAASDIAGDLAARRQRDA